MKKALITIFAFIGVISTVLILLGVGYLLGTKDRTSAPIPTVTATPEPIPTVAVETVESVETPVPTNTPTPTVAPTATSTPSPTPTATSTPTPTATPTCTPSPTPSYTFTEITGKDKPHRAIEAINVYREPTKDSLVIDTAPLDRTLIALRVCSETGLVEINYYSPTLGDINGWVDPAFLVKFVVEDTTTPTQTPTQEETTKPSESTSSNTNKEDTTSQKPTPTPTTKPSNPGYSPSDIFTGSQFAEFAKAGEKFTDTVNLNGQQVEISGTIKIHGNVVAEGFKYEGEVILIEVKDTDKLTNRQIDSIWSAYQYIYGDEASCDYNESGNLCIQLFWGHSDIIDSDIELNTH